jgi:hypothetical protein
MKIFENKIKYPPYLNPIAINFIFDLLNLEIYFDKIFIEEPIDSNRTIELHNFRDNENIRLIKYLLL